MYCLMTVEFSIYFFLCKKEKVFLVDENYRLVSILVKNLEENFRFKIFLSFRKSVGKLPRAKNVQQCCGANQQKLNANWTLNPLIINLFKLRRFEWFWWWNRNEKEKGCCGGKLWKFAAFHFLFCSGIWIERIRCWACAWRTEIWILNAR